MAILVSNEALTALEWFGIEAAAASNEGIKYNDVLRWVYDTLYEHNVECDFVWEESQNLNEYKMIVVPVLYAADERVLKKLNDYINNGGVLVATFKSGFANENVKVYHSVQPHIIHQALGVTYHQFTFPKNVVLSGDITCGAENFYAEKFMELLIPEEDTQVLASYGHYNWKDYAAVTRHPFGEGFGYYLGCMTDKRVLWKVFDMALKDAGLDVPKAEFPLILRKGRNEEGKAFWFYLNYSPEVQRAVHEGILARDIFTKEQVDGGGTFEVKGWDLRILAES